jgi:folate-binding protein YgfZ
LRSSVKIEDISTEYAIAARWNELESADKRCDWKMDRRLESKNSNFALTTDNTIYNMLRMIKGVPEGASEIVRGRSIPMEYNLDLMGHIDRHKGCYLGQELVSRTLNKGVVRKRIMPLKLFDENITDFAPNPLKDFSGIQFEADIYGVEPQDAKDLRDLNLCKKVIGKFIAAVGNVAIAMIRLEEMPSNGMVAIHRPTLQEGDPTMIFAQLSIPSWWPFTF